jgi:hypothetical protein
MATSLRQENPSTAHPSPIFLSPYTFATLPLSILLPASAAKAKSASLYDVDPGVAMLQKWVAELKPKTGRSLEERIVLLKKGGPKDSQSRRAWLKSKHKRGTNSAWWTAVEGRGGEEDTPAKYLASAVQYVEEQYSA